MKPILLLALADDVMTPAQLDEIEALAPHLRLARTRRRAEIEAMLDHIEIAVGAFPHDLIVQAPKLRWVQQWGAGADWLLRYPAVRELDLILTNTSGIHAVPISEHIFALMLAYGRRLPDALHAQGERIWIGNRWQKAHGTSIRADQRYATSFDKHDMAELAGKTLLIAGVGAIGARTARIAQAFDMRVIGMRRKRAASMEGVDRCIGPDELMATLPEADIVINTLPLTAETRKLFGEGAFTAMPAHAGYITIGRGGTTDEAALIDALQGGVIAWAGLDVFETEPLPPESPLWSMPNVLVTPHYSGLTPEYDRRAMEILLDNLGRYVRGEPMRNVVNKRAGY
jgi:phosphoglycerate dehydrogenase-like enzyme